jgi:hypothetical protein
MWSLVRLFAFLLLATPVVAQTDPYLASNGTFKIPFALTNTWTAVQTFNVASVFGVLPSVPLAQFQILQGNGSGIAAPVTFSAAIDAALGSTRGSILERAAGGWQIVAPGTTALPWVSNGTGADPGYQALTNSSLANMVAAGLKGATAAGPVADLTAVQALGVLKTAPWPDTSEVIGSGATKWNPLFFTNAGTGIVHRFNRILCGEATASSGDIGPVTTKDWLETLVSNTTAAAQSVCIDTVGQLGVVGASRTSDFRTFNGSASQGSQGVSGFAYNNDTGAGNPIAAGLFGQALHAASVTGVSEAIEMNMSSNATVVDVTPFGGVVAGNTFASNTSAGFAGFTNNISAAHLIGQSVAPAQFRKGTICLNGALDATVGAGGNGVCMEMARNQTVRWLNSGGTTDGEITANALGIQFLTDQAWTAFTATPTCGTATIATNSAKRKTLGKTTFIQVDFTISALGTCTNASPFTFTLPNTSNSTGGISGRETSVTTAMWGCTIINTATQMTCGLANAANPANTYRFIASGVYENQ